jgi:hypothetical protein
MGGPLGSRDDWPKDSNGGGAANSSGSFASLRMTARTNNGKNKTGKGNGKDKGNAKDNDNKRDNDNGRGNGRCESDGVGVG